MLQERIQEVQAKVAALIAQANQRYNIVLPPVEVRFDLEGRSAGQAGVKQGRYYLRFNSSMMQRSSWDHIINDTVPHEVAHLVCFYKPTLGRQHNPGWKQVCRYLGGSGLRCHSEEVVYSRGQTYAYTTSTGAVINLSQIMHHKIQKGAAYRIKGPAGGGIVNNSSAWSVVSEQTNRDNPRPSAQAPTETHTGTKAAQIRAKIREGLDQTRVIAWAMNTLGMSRAQAQRYVKENWSRA